MKRPAGAKPAGQKPLAAPAVSGAISEDEAALINFRERAESGTEWLALLDEAGARDDYLAELAATSSTLGQLNTVVERAKKLGKYTVLFITAERARRPDLQARADSLGR